MLVVYVCYFMTECHMSIMVPHSHLVLIRRSNACVERRNGTYVPKLDRMTNKFSTRGEMAVDMYDDMDTTEPITLKRMS